MRWNPVRTLLGGGLGLAAVASASLAQPAPSPASPAAQPGSLSDQGRFFESKIRPLLIERCQKCHGPTQQSGGLRLDSPVGMTRGGGRGPAIAAGDPDRSLLIRAVRHDAGAPKMPPGEKLSGAEISALAAWVKQGIPWPVERVQGSGFRVQEGTQGSSPTPTQHWAFQPVRMPAVPKMKNAKWVRTPIDAFILARLEKEGLRPSPQADARTLIRRVTFDLTGLPPTVSEVDQFLRECAGDLPRQPPSLKGRGSHRPYGTPPGRRNSPFPLGEGSVPVREKAYERLVHRLLASPAYGERWGRHWLDVARYADTNGMDENVHYGNAWRYRDYVIRSFNDDKPYNRFLVEQIAGDLLAKELEPGTRQAGSGSEGPRATGACGELIPPTTDQRELLIATGFFSIGPKLISEVDTEKVVMDTVDEQIDTLGRTVMGLTLGCARCHNHKFDPISTEDYYALAGIFKSTKTLDVMKKPRMWYEHPIATPDERAQVEAYQKRIAAQKDRIAKTLSDATARLKASLAAGAALPKNVEAALAEADRAELKRQRDELAELEKKAPELPMAMGVTEGTVADVPVHIRGSHLSLGKVVPRHFPTVLAASQSPAFDSKQSGRVQLAEWLVRPDHPLTSRVIVNRVWRWHFGTGLVRTTDNFGFLGEKASHPGLLDWLAGAFVSAPTSGQERVGERENGGVGDAIGRWACNWSFKKLHRLIVLSNAYRQASVVGSPRARTADPENRLLWRWEPRRLEVEEIRDSLLAVSGLLDRTMGGSILPLKNREYVFDHTSKDATKYDSRRRAVYLPVVRNHLYDMFQLFDFGDGAMVEGNRPTTTVAPQALFMLNSDVIEQTAAALAEELLKQDVDASRRIRSLYQRLYARPASPQEVARARSLLARFDALQASEADANRRNRQSWAWLCHTLLASNEFIYVG